MSSRSPLAILLVAALLGAAFLLGRGRMAPAPGPAPSPASTPLPVPGAALAADAAAQPAAGSARVGFIDLETVYNSCRQTKAFDLEMAKFMDDAHKGLESLQQELKKLEEGFRLLAQDAPERAAQETEIRRKQEEYRKASEPWEKDLNRKSLKKREEIYGLIRAAAARVARARGIDLVLGDIEEPHADFKADNSRELELALREYSVKMQRKAVLYASRDVDLTAAVLEAVNAEP